MRTCLYDSKYLQLRQPSHGGQQVSIVMLIIGVLAWCGSVAADPLELRNDGFESGDTVALQGGFAYEEIAAVRLDLPEPGRYRVDSVKFLLIGNEALLPGTGTGTEVSMGIYIWEDDGEVGPGDELFYASVQLTSSAENFQEVELDKGVIVEGPFRVGVEFYHDELPGIVRDVEPPITYPEHNFIKDEMEGWIYMGDGTGLPDGNWVIRALLEPVGAEEPEPEPEPGPSIPDAGVPEPDAGSGAPRVPPDEPMNECRVHSECSVGQYCSIDGTCTDDCRLNSDCTLGMRCTRQGMCERDSSAGGCDSNSGQPSSPAWLLLLGILGLLRLAWRRRRPLS